MIFKYTINVPCLSNHRDNKFTKWLVHSPLLFTCQNSTDRNWSPMLTAKWATTGKVIFHVEVWFHKPDMLWRTNAGCADIRPWHRNRQDSISVTMLRVRSKFFHIIRQNSKHDSILNRWPIRVHFRWPCLSDLLCMVGGSSDLCGNRSGAVVLPYRPRLIPSGWLTTQVSGDRAYCLKWI